MTSEPSAAAGLEDREHAERERGATLVLASLTIIVLIGMAGFAVDLGWLYLKANQTLKAAESSSLAGVVHMPKPGSVAWGPGAQAWDAAVDVAGRNGYVSGSGTTVTPTEVSGHPNQLRVDIEATVPTFFMRVFGINSVTFTRGAVAEHLPPLKMGSDDPFLGKDPTDPSRNTHYWLSVNGTYTGKNEGDPYSTVCYAGSGGSGPPYASPVPTGCSATGNYEYRDPAYYFAVSVPASDAGNTLAIDVYDGAWSDPSFTTGDYHYNWDVTPYVTTFRLLAPDQTPDDPSDNSVEICHEDYHALGNPSYDPTEAQAWDTLCTTTAVEGIYVLELSVAGDTYSNNKFSLRSRINGSTSNSVEMWGFGALSLAMHDPNTSPAFKIVRLDPIYAGTSLVIGLWDAGDIGEPGSLTFGGALTGLECRVRELDDHGTVVNNWHADDGGSGCHLDVAPNEHNNQWVEFQFDIPSTYTCPGTCWADVTYAFGASPHDRTTWTAIIQGGPVHLLP
jgi:Putative Flp pilus-assembly TadE/G-like